MVTRALKSADGVIPGGADDEQQQEEQEESPLDRISQAFSDVDTERASKVQLWRHVYDAKVGKKRLEWLCDYEPAEFEHNDLSLIRDKWGPGQYQLRLYGYKNGSNYKTVLARPEFYIGADPAAPNLAVAANPIVAQAQNDLTAMVQMLAAGQQRMLEALTARPDSMAQMKDMFGLMALMREATGANTAAPQKSSIGEIIDAIKELKGVQSLIGGEEPKSETERLMEMAQPLIGMVQQAVQQPPAQVMPQVAMPMQFAPRPPVPQPMQQMHERNPIEIFTPAPPTVVGPNELPPLDQPVEQIEMLLREQLTKLLTMAEEKKPVSEGAEFAYEVLPDEFIEILHAPFWFAALQSYESKVNAHTKWFEGVRNELLKMFKEDEQTEEKAS